MTASTQRTLMMHLWCSCSPVMFHSADQLWQIIQNFSFVFFGYNTVFFLYHVCLWCVLCRSSHHSHPAFQTPSSSRGFAEVSVCNKCPTAYWLRVKIPLMETRNSFTHYVLLSTAIPHMKPNLLRVAFQALLVARVMKRLRHATMFLFMPQ